MALRGQHSVPIPDLIIAAAAEPAGMLLLHNDADFYRIAAVAGQAMERVVVWGPV
ncbi:MAG: hypothetical protein OXU64_08315 [Gemmatimonadota bacterium]|nr:hypothetical protein [Gemmatimonadota bacterium]